MTCENEPCPNEALSGFVWCRWCINALAEERHQADKVRWAKEAEAKEEEEVP